MVVQGEAELAVVVDGERAGPAVEDLDDVGAGFDLLAGEAGEHGDKLFHQQRPGGGLGAAGKSGRVHHFFRFDVVARAAAFDHVAGEGEGCAAEADDAECVAVGAGRGEVFLDAFDRLSDVAQFVDAVGLEGFDLGGGADGGMDLGAFAGDELEVDAHGGEGEKQVGEDDGRVDAEALGCGDGDLGGNLRGAADLEQGVVLADSHVLRHVAAGLAEEPDGGPVDGLAETGAHEAAGPDGHGQRIGRQDGGCLGHRQGRSPNAISLAFRG